MNKNDRTTLKAVVNILIQNTLENSLAIAQLQDKDESVLKAIKAKNDLLLKKLNEFPLE